MTEPAPRPAQVADLRGNRQLTPMLRQYLEIHDQAPDAVLLFRMGDFYETFFEDAQTVARALDLTLTTRDKFGDLPIPMAGVPHHAVRGYIRRLVEAGHKVAIADQLEDPKQAKGIVKRGLTEVITPGTILDPDSLDARSANYLLALFEEAGRVGLAAADVSTGEFLTTVVSAGSELAAELDRLGPREILHPESMNDRWPPGMRPADGVRVAAVVDHAFARDAARRELCDLFSVRDLGAWGLEDHPLALAACGAVLHTLRSSQLAALGHLRPPRVYEVGDAMVLDEATRRNLELFRSMADGKRQGSLLALLDQCATTMGSRRLRAWLSSPLLDPAAIRARQDAVAALVDNPPLRERLRDCLAAVADLERLHGKLMTGRAHGRDLLGLRQGLEQAPTIDVLLSPPPLRSLPAFAALPAVADLAREIALWLADDAPLALKEGGLLRRGVHADLDELIDLSRDGKSSLAKLETEERARTGIDSLKIKYTAVFGYFIEITRSNLHRVPPDYHRKQTVANAERYFTPQLKEFEQKVLHAEERRCVLEYELFLQLRARVAEGGARVADLALRLAEIDVLCALAELAARGDYVRPEVDGGTEIRVTDGRHPVIERMRLGERFVPNDLLLDRTDNQLLVITGPNMAGKSTVMRQAALLVLMAQIGSFIPAKAAKIGVVDRIFTRVGASDNLARGQSTFMVEMSETAAILAHATHRSLAILDEIGRGTSTYDGLAIAWAVAEFLADRIGCRTLFATHYHELCELARTRTQVKNWNIAVSEVGGRVIFLRRLKEGAASRSYGIAVARLAGLPEVVILRAREVLANLEREGLQDNGTPRLARHKGEKVATTGQLSLFAPPVDAIRQAVLSIDPDRLTPLEALSLLADLKRRAGGAA